MLKKIFRPSYLSRALQLAALLFLAGCELLPLTLLPAIMPVVAAGATGGVSYTFNSIAYATIAHPVEDVKEANLTALKRMEITVVDIRENDYRVKIKAQTRRLAINITLVKMTPKLTKIKVNAKKYLVIKDKLTALEIIIHTGKSLPEEEWFKAAPGSAPGLVSGLSPAS